MPTPFTPARNAPPPVPPPSPGPSPPPEPLPMPVPLPWPNESEFAFAIGSPNVGKLLFIFKSGGPSSEGSIASFGSGLIGFTCGGVNCVYLNFGTLPLFTGVSVWSLAPPPPPAGFAPEGNLETYGEISIDVTSMPVLLLASIGLESQPYSIIAKIPAKK